VGKNRLAAGDIARIRELHAHWVAGELAGDEAAVLDLCAGDVAWIPPDAPPLRGKKAIRQWLGKGASKIHDLAITGLAIRGAGPVAYLTANYATNYTPEGGRKARRITGTHVWILRKTPGAGWKVAVVCWSCRQ